MADSETPQETPATVERTAQAAPGGPGATLRAAREASGQGAADIARVLCLELRLVEAIEDDRYEAFGAAVFARGHVRRYAQALELDASALVRSWDERYATAPPPAVPDPKVAPVAEHSGGISASVVIALLMLVLGGAAVFVWWWLRPPGPGVTAAQAGVAPAPASVSVATPAQGNAVPAARRAADESSVTPVDLAAGEPDGSISQGEDGVDDADGLGASATSVPVTLPSPAQSAPEVLAPPSAPAGAEDGAPVQATSGDIGQALAAAGPAPVANDGEVAVRFIFDEACWVSVRDAVGKTLMLGLREPGTVNDRTGVPPIAVTLGRYPGVRIEVDGETFEVPPTAIDGAIARFEISPR